MLKKTVKISVLYDFYNQLLTEKQRDIVDLYYNQDLSLGEIAEELDVSRQAVYDMLKRTERILYQYEEKLNLIKLANIKNKRILNILDGIIDLENELNSIPSSRQLTKQIFRIKDELYKVLND
ncbi:MAG: YlxM family DNA-binding protein [Natronincolaceae bacterium]|nr:putative DNA-binding protein [Bacillota bacterium]NLK90764.1 putative DNA-binding protein [Clostridiales bacterium]